MKNIFLILVVGAALLLGVAGCESFSGSSGYLTSVTILNRPMGEVQGAVTNVFSAHLYAGGSSGTNQFTFTRAGSSLDKLAYGSSMFQRSITVKVKVTTRQQAPDVILVGCAAMVVEADGDPTFEEDHPIGVLGKGPYEDLLKEIKKQLGQ